MRPFSQRHLFLFPIGARTGDVELFDIIDVEPQIVVSRFRGHLPPEAEVTGTGRLGRQPRLLTVSDVAALGRIHAVMCRRRLPKPCCVAAGRKGQIATVK